MRAFGSLFMLQARMDMRDRGILLVYDLVPVVFYVFVGAVFTAINPIVHETLIASMCAFAVTMGAMLGTPQRLVELFSGDLDTAYRLGGVPVGRVVLAHALAAFLHLSAVCALIYASAPLLFDAPMPAQPLPFIGGLALFVATSVALGTLLGLCCNTQGKATLYAQLIFLPSMMISGMMFPADLLPEAMQAVSSVLPATCAMNLLTKGQGGFAFALFGICALCIALCALRLRFLARPKA